MTPSRLHMTLVYFGFRDEGGPTTDADADADRHTIHVRRAVAVGAVLLTGYRVAVFVG